MAKNEIGEPDTDFEPFGRIMGICISIGPEMAIWKDSYSFLAALIVIFLRIPTDLLSLIFIVEWKTSYCREAVCSAFEKAEQVRRTNNIGFTNIKFKIS